MTAVGTEPLAWDPLNEKYKADPHAIWKRLRDEQWNKRVRKAIAYLDAATFFDHLYIGGGNGPRVNRRDLGEVLERITVVDNKAGILGGIKLWEAHHIGVEGGV